MALTLNYLTNFIIEEQINIREPTFSLFHRIQIIPNTHYLGLCQIHNYDDKRYWKNILTPTQQKREKINERTQTKLSVRFRPFI